MMFVNPKHVRKDKLAPGGGYQNSGVSGDPTKSTAALGKVFIQIKIDNAVAQIKSMIAGTYQAPEPPQRGAGGACRRRGSAGWRTGRTRRTRRSGRRRGRRSRGQPGAAGTAPADDGDGAGGHFADVSAPDTVFIDELTWEETRDALKAGKTTAIIPTGGTEKNGYHMVLGKHNFIVTHSANLMARRLKNALVAPTIQYVPEGNPDRAGPGVISLPSPAYDQLLDAAARSLKAHGFKDIIFIGDSGGNQAGMRAVADALNKEWAGSDVQGVRAHRLLRTGPRPLSRLARSGVRLRRSDRSAATPASATRRSCSTCARPACARIRSSPGAARRIPASRAIRRRRRRRSAAWGSSSRSMRRSLN